LGQLVKIPKNFFLTITAAAAVLFLVSCAEQPASVSHTTAAANAGRLKVRTTAYTGSESGGRRNALGKSLSGKHLRSAASDWSRFPLGTRFRIANSNEEYVIDDYGTALIGTNTIDLYKPTRLEMRRWGVRHVNIDVLQWGSETESLKVLSPRAKHRLVRQMIAGLEKKKAKPIAEVSRTKSSL
jgi:3D (Asp-Asp-Asp) domain-containing protein